MNQNNNDNEDNPDDFSTDIEFYNEQRKRQDLDVRSSVSDVISFYPDDTLFEDDKRNNSYSQGYSFPLRVLWFHFLSILQKLKKVEYQGKKIEVEDLPELEDHVKVQYTRNQLKRQIESLDPLKVTQYQFLRILGKTFRSSVLGILAYIFFETLTKLFSPYCTAQLINLVKEGETQSASIWVFLLVITNFLGTTFGQNSWTKAQRLSAQLRLGLISILFDKVSNLSAYSVKKANVGKIINIISSDFSSFENSGVYIFHSLLAPFTLTISSGILIYRLGYVGIIAIILLVLLFPLQKKIAQLASNYTKLQTKERDSKVKLFSEMIEGIKIIKMYGWEKAFKTTITKWRQQELKYTLINQLVVYLEQTISLNGPLFVALFCFLLIDISGGDFLNTSIIFSTIELINLISSMIMRNVGFGLNFIFDFKVLVQRYMSIIAIENIQMKSIDNNQNHQEKPESDVLVKMNDFTAYWHSENLETKTPVLKNINFTIKQGETISIIGQIGSGKSSILFAIMKEIPRYKGQFHSTSNLSYVDQEPYILQGTVRDNILFGKTFQQKFYNQVIEACCLNDDFNLLANQDQTVVGERGTNLSGGQKARICLARAVYVNTDLYLLDDPLSAVDSKVAKKIFNNVINGLLKDKAVILVTHQLNYALKCQKIAVFDNGSIIIQGNPQEINFSESSLAKYIDESHSIEENEKVTNEGDLIEESDKQQKEQIQHKQENQNINLNASKQSQTELVKKSNEDEFPVTLSTYFNFIKINPRPFLFIGVVAIFIIQEILFTSFYKIISLYELDISKSYFYSITFGVFISMFIFKYLQNSSISYFILKSTQNMSQKMTTSLCQAKPILFDEIPSGSIINKYSNDINILDKSLPESSFTTLEGLLHFVNLIGSVVYFNNFFIIPGIIEVYLFYKWFIYIKSILMRAKQLDLENKSPVFQFFQSSLNGVLIINVYGQKQAFQQKMDTLMNNSIRTYDVFWFISRLFSVYMQFTALLTSALGIALILFWSQQNYIQFAQSLSFFLLLTNFLHVTLRSFINMDTFMTSSERAYSIINLPKEEFVTQDIEDIDTSIVNSNKIQRQRPTHKYNLVQNVPDQDTVNISYENLKNTSNQQIIVDQWPNKGNLVFDKVYMKYKENLEHVLKGVSFEANQSEKLAIVGRTGAGKSSIVQSLFRLSEIEQHTTEGNSRILYDNQNTRNVSLHQLRRSISIIPQNPFIFSGSIRHNIDPLEEYSDSQIINVLQETGLYEVISKQPENIHTDMSDSSSLFSMGQKQLVSLARVMLKNNKLMVLDEATANVDMSTDQKIQQLLKEKFQDTTIITIAHRLNTIADYDKVIVLDQGKVVEIDSPFKLLANNDKDETITNNTSLFSQMVLHTGSKNAQQIFQISKQSYLEKKKYM